MQLDNAIGVAFCLLAAAVGGLAQVPEDLTDHGVPVPAAENRGYTVSVDGEGKRVVLIWQMNGGTKYQLVIYADTGETRQVPVEPYAGDNAFAVWHSSRDLWYSAYGSHFYEFDPKTLSFTFGGETPRRCAMSMHEDSSGIIWAALYSSAYLVSFDPETRELVNHGQVNEETWGQYPTYMAVDEAGWVYVGIGNTLGQLVGYNPATGERRAYVAQENRKHGVGRPFVGTDGKVYATAPGWDPHVLLAGEATPIEGAEGMQNNQLVELLAQREPAVRPDPVRGSRSHSRRSFPDGSRISKVDLEARLLSVVEADGTTREVAFDYKTPGPGIAVLYAAADAKIYGSTAHPSRLFCYDPAKDQLVFYPAGKIAFKSLRTQDNYLFGGHYSGGKFWLLDTSKPITLTPVPSIFGQEITYDKPEEGAPDNPLLLGGFNPNINIPRNAFAHPDGKHIMISGQPGYGYVGGGLVIYNLETKEITELTHEDLIAGYSTMAIAALPNGDLLCGTSPRGGHGTNAVHDYSCIYILDWETKRVTWQSEPLAQMQSMQSMIAGPDGLYYCVGGGGEFLVFDAESKEIVHEASLSEYGGHTTNQAMILGPDNKIYLGLTKALLRITPGSFEVEVLATPPGGVEAGLGIIAGRLYFGSRSHLMSIGL